MNVPKASVSVEPEVQVRTYAFSRGEEVMVRPRVAGKFFFVGDEKCYVRGVTYGPFAEDEQWGEYGSPGQVARDFAAMAERGINTVRVYTVPPVWLLDEAERHGLRVFVGIPWEQHITFLDEPARRRAIVRHVRQTARRFKGHRAVFGYAVGNEIPPTIVRWYGRRRIERFIKRLYLAVKREDGDAQVTYVNFPTTEYLQLGFLDFRCFNVYLEEPGVLRRYLLRLQNQTNDRPLLMGEIGLDSQRNGVQRQAAALRWQIATTFAAGAAGAFVFAWTDEWHRGGEAIEDWDFGLTDRLRRAKPALEAVEQAFAATPLAADRDWPRVSVVVCTYNGHRTIEQTLRSLTQVVYERFEVIVVNDGSRDGMAQVLARLEEELRDQLDLKVIEIPNGGLSHARNVGMRSANGEIVAYLDDDAMPDPHWLQYLVDTFLRQKVVAVGGPNLPVPGDNDAALCVAHSPGGPNHVLLSDEVAEHIPGCNMAFRKSALEAVGGFDPQFRIAGDDVDLCWRLQARGGVIGFNPAAMVWHHRRHQLRAYLRQQGNYGRAEAMLQKKWPGKYNQLGHVSWQGRLYGAGMTLPLFLRRWRIYHGVWGTGLFQTLYVRSPGVFRSMPLMPEWYLVAMVVAVMAVASLLWKPMLFFLPAMIWALGVPVMQALVSAWQTEIRGGQSRWRRIKLRMTIAALHLFQPVVRLHGRLLQGLTPWRRPSAGRCFSLSCFRTHRIWNERWRSPESILAELESALHRVGASPIRGGEFDRWDLEARGGMFGGVRVLLGVEEHGQGKQMILLRTRPRIGSLTPLLIITLSALTVGVALLGQAIVSLVLATAMLGLIYRTVGDYLAGLSAYLESVELLSTGVKASREREADDGEANRETGPCIAYDEVVTDWATGSR